MTLAVIGIVYGSLVAFAQNDVKKLIAYSSVAHLGFVVLGIIMLNAGGVDGAHLPDAGARHLDGRPVLLRRRALRAPPHAPLDEFGGLSAMMPVLRRAASWSSTLASVGLPGLSGFVGEFLVLIGTFDAYKTWAAPAHAASSRLPS